jgi:hypothetical protein
VEGDHAAPIPSVTRTEVAITRVTRETVGTGSTPLEPRAQATRIVWILLRPAPGTDPTDVLTLRVTGIGSGERLAKAVPAGDLAERLAALSTVP